MINCGRCNISLLPFPLINSVPPGFKTLFKLESFSPGTADRCADIKMGNGGQPIGESCMDLLGNFLRRQIGCWPVGKCVCWVAQVFLHPGQLQDQHRQGDQTH